MTSMVSDRPLTRNQTVVLDTLRHSEMPLTAYQILDLDTVRDAGLKAPLSVYRALDKLVERGLVHRIERLNAFVSCDHGPHASPAAFMICQDCKRIIEVSADDVRSAVARAALKQEFEIETFSLEATGHCAQCLN